MFVDVEGDGVSIGSNGESAMGNSCSGDGEVVSLMTGDGSLTSGDGSLTSGDVSSGIPVWRGTAVLPPGVDIVDSVEVFNCSDGRSTGRGSGCRNACAARSR